MENRKPKIDAVFLCRQPGRGTSVDEIYSGEAAAAIAAGLPVELIDHDAAAAGDFERAVRGLNESGRGRRFLYRGWMLGVRNYQGLIEYIEEHRGWRAITSPQDYEACHCLAGWAHKIAPLTPRSEWISHKPPFAPEELTGLLEKFEGPVIVKDYVKSEKHAWADACFIPDVRDTDRAIAVINRFLELRGQDFEGGLVLRAFVPLKPIGVNARSGMPLSRELRSFWAGSRCIAINDYWRRDDPASVPDVAQEAARLIDRPFYTIDLALTTDGAWVVMEIGDGQVSALPESLTPAALYAGLLMD